MTTATMQRVQRRTYDVYSKADGDVHLVLEELADGCSIAVKLPEGAKSKLGTYWPVEAHEWLQKLDMKYGSVFSLETRGLKVSSDQPIGKWVGAAISLLANIHPFGKLPMYSRAYGTEGFWKVDKRANLAAIIDGVKLPETASHFFNLWAGSDFVKLQRKGIERSNCPLPIAIVRQMVELQVARMCYENGVPLNYDELYDRKEAKLRREMLAKMTNRRSLARPIVTVELPPMPRRRKRTRAGMPVEPSKQ